MSTRRDREADRHLSWIHDQIDELANSFAFHPPANSKQVQQHEAIRQAFIKFGTELSRIVPGDVPQSARYWALTKTSLEQAAMWAAKAVAMTSPATRDKRLDL